MEIEWLGGIPKEDYQTGRCRIPASKFKELDLRVGDLVSVQYSEKDAKRTAICTVWPSPVESENTTIQFDALLICDENFVGEINKGYAKVQRINEVPVRAQKVKVRLNNPKGQSAEVVC
jgi:hypothetical protein